MEGELMKTTRRQDSRRIFGGMLRSSLWAMALHHPPTGDLLTVRFDGLVGLRKINTLM